MISIDPSSAVDVFFEKSFWNEKSCRVLLEIAEKSNVEEAGVYRDGRLQVDPNLRKTRRILLDQPLFAEIGNSLLSVKPRIEEHFQLTLQGLQGVQFLQYRAGDYFHTHADEWEPPSDSTRKISIIL
ncbi:MAG TPA: hypothetical protein VLH08_18200, partial [Acidobacteriota bacterium]|nr:hypothetical protein [Acidobacteriota bacterium]